MPSNEATRQFKLEFDPDYEALEAYLSLPFSVEQLIGKASISMAELADCAIDKIPEDFDDYRQMIATALDHLEGLNPPPSLLVLGPVSDEFYVKLPMAYPTKDS